MSPVPLIREKSPHLASVLTREFQESAELVNLELCFNFAINQGALAEIDFVRDEEASYNPRPARVALILLNNAKIRNLAYLASGILASVSKLNELKPENQIPSAVWETAVEAQQDSENFLRCWSPKLRPAATIMLSHSLDRARHVHLADWSIDAKKIFIEETEKQLQLAKLASPELEILLMHWLERYRRKYEASVKC